jgi:hypothetical protein
LTNTVIHRLGTCTPLVHGHARRTQGNRAEQNSRLLFGDWWGLVEVQFVLSTVSIAVLLAYCQRSAATKCEENV